MLTPIRPNGDNVNGLRLLQPFEFECSNCSSRQIIASSYQGIAPCAQNSTHFL